MKESKLFFNKRWAFWIGIFSVLILLGIYTLSEELTISIIIIVIGCICLLGYVFLFPNSYRIDEKGIAVYYGFGIKTSAKWNELHTIEDHYCRAFLWMREYRIGYFKKALPLLEKACIPKNKKTTILIEKYYKKTIEKYG